MPNFQNDLLCFSHLRWTFVFQRPQHLMSRFARDSRVYFVEEPVFEGRQTRLAVSVCPRTGVRVVTPFISENPHRGSSSVSVLLRGLIEGLLRDQKIRDFAAWYYTPMALEFTEDLNPTLMVYDCMDELSAFANAPAGMLKNEQLLFQNADLVFTGGPSLFEAKRSKHEQVHLFPSSVDVAHFSQALAIHEDPADQKPIPRPRIGYAGVIDERMDLELIEYLADRRPDWQIVLVGPVVKIDPDRLPRGANIHYPGMKAYDELPAYLSGWDVALLPFARNDATRFISPTKTSEYLAAGLPVVSTPIRDVVRRYGESGLVCIGGDHEQFLQGVKQQLCEGRSAAWQADVREFLSSQSWDKTWNSMQRLMTHHAARKRQIVERRADATVLTPEASAAPV
jgi:glycosyltransferase involved in cell wall biosynthesis